MSSDRRIPGYRQRGVVLIVVLVLLTVLTILGTAGMQTTAMEERMAGNFRDLGLAFEAAEAALRTGEEGVVAYNVSGVTNAVDSWTTLNYRHDVAAGSVSVDWHTSSAWDDNWTAAVPDAWFTDDHGELMISSAPRYYLERLPAIALPNSSLVQGFQNVAPTVQYFRITARGVGVSSKSNVIVQSTYFR